MRKQKHKKNRFELLAWGNPEELSKFKEKTKEKYLVILIVFEIS